ncbi:integral membrane protein [Paecilomyces variotii]|uniref:Integral membrane protein n=1 Tax=Byssochlamys spectabilis TaxID=264951 RepID=A0A443HUQ4_BYSSP|nr:integral membrane protein [Paecilomyces variotii]KAJ9341061.1 hypothetical protein DTO027B6_6333 [Paecilomyces variotii]RWQ95484.1 integral membrane protein [Paecilomyces variotii]
MAESKAARLVTVNAVMLLLATISSAVRLWVRSVYMKGLGSDDVCFTFSYVFTCVLCVVSALMVRYGAGQHLKTLDPEDIERFLQLDFVISIAYIFAFITIKVSFLLFYLRIFPGKRVLAVCYGCIVFLICQCIEETAVVIFQCSPVQKAWDSTVPGKCLNLLTFFYVSFGIKLASDLVIFFLPIPLLYKTKLSRGKKTGVIAMFALGFLVCLTSIIRATQLQNTSTDMTYIIVDELDWSSIEVTVAVICACIPSFKALITYKFPTIRRVLGLTSSDPASNSRGYSSRYGRMDKYNITGSHQGHVRMHKLPHSTMSRMETDIHASDWDDSKEQIAVPGEIKVTTDLTVNRVDDIE